jgi:hypothetical protein
MMMEIHDRDKIRNNFVEGANSFVCKIRATPVLAFAKKIILFTRLLAPPRLAVPLFDLRATTAQ